MKDTYKTKKQLINELIELRNKITKVELLEKKRKQTEKALSESEKRYKELAEMMNELVYVADPISYSSTYVNKAAVNTYGYTKEEWLSDPSLWLKTIHPEDRERVIAQVDEAKAKKENVILEHRIVDKNKKIKWLEDRLRWRKDKKGEIVGLQGIALDVTERKQAEDKLRKAYDELETRVNERTAALEKVNAELRLEITEREQAEKKLRESEERYRLFADSTSDMVYVKDEQLRYILVNKTLLEFHGKKEDEIIGKTVFELLPKLAAEKCTETDKKVLEEDTFVITEEQIGDKFYETRKFPIKLPNNMKGIGGCIKEVIQRKSAEEALRESEQRFRTIFESASDGILIADVETKKIYLGNKKICKMLGYSLEEIKDLTVMDIHPEKDLLHVLEQFDKLAEEKITIAENIPVTRKDRSIFYVDISAFFLTLDRKTYIAGIFRDITEREQAERALLEREKHYREILNAMGDWILVVDQELKILLFNEAFMQINKALGLNLDVIGRTPMEIFPFLPQTIFDEYRWVFENGKVLVTEETTKVEDREFVTESRKIPLFQDGKVAMVVSVIRDITEKKHLEDRLQHAQKMEAVGTLAGGIAHDFNNILTAIIGFGNLLQEEIGEKEPFKKYVATILASARRAADLTQGLLAFSRTQIIYPRPVNLNQVVKELKDFLSRLMGEAIELSMVLTEEDLTVMADSSQIEADSSQIEMVLINLATNAIDVMPERGSFIIRTERIQLDYDFIKTHKYGKHAPYALMTIEDTG